jgi:hypothetical protein
MRMSAAWIAAALAFAGCGSIAYDDGRPSERVTVTTTGGYVVQRAPGPPVPGPYVTVLPGVAHAPPPAPVAPMPRPPAGAVQCGNGDHVRIRNQRIDGGAGPAIVASAGCLVEISESIVRGVPAVVALDGARVVLSESRIQGGIEASPGAIVATPGSRIEQLALR